MKERHDELQCYLRVLKLNCGWTQIFDFSRNSLAYQSLLLKAQFIQEVNPLLWQQWDVPPTQSSLKPSVWTQAGPGASKPPSWAAATITPLLSRAALSPLLSCPFFSCFGDKDPDKGAQEVQLGDPNPVPFHTCTRAADFCWAPHRDPGYYSITPTYLFDENINEIISDAIWCKWNLNPKRQTFMFKFHFWGLSAAA